MKMSQVFYNFPRGFYSSCDLDMAELVKTADGVLDVCCVPEYTEYTLFQ